MFNFLKNSSPSSYHFLLNSKNKKTPLYLKNDKNSGKRSIKSILYLQVDPFANLDLVFPLACRNFNFQPLPFFVLSDHGYCSINLSNSIKLVNPQNNFINNNVVLDNPELVHTHEIIEYVEELLPLDSNVQMGTCMQKIIQDSYEINAFCSGFLINSFYKEEKEKIAKSKKQFFDYLEFVSQLEIKKNKPFIFAIAYSNDNFNKEEIKFIHDTLAVIKAKNCIIFNCVSDYGYMKDNHFPALGSKGIYDEYWLSTSGLSSEVFYDIYNIHKSSVFDYLPQALKKHFKKHSDFLEHALKYKNKSIGQSCFMFKDNKTWEFATNIT